MRSSELGLTTSKHLPVSVAAAVVKISNLPTRTGPITSALGLVRGPKRRVDATRIITADLTRGDCERP